MARPRSAAHPFQALYLLHYGFVWHAVRRFGVVPALTDDAVQDTFIAAYRRWGELAMPSAKAWLYGIARRVASNYRRADHRATRKRGALATAMSVAPPTTAPPEVVIHLDRFLEALAPVDRELFVLSEIEGMSGPEAANALELNVSTTYSRVQSLRRRFRESFADGDVVVQAARDQRPRATAHGWAILLPKLGIATTSAVKAAPILAWGLVAKVSAVAMPIAMAIGLSVTRSERAPVDVPVVAAAIEPVAAAAPAPAIVAVARPSIAAPEPVVLPATAPLEPTKPTVRAPARAPVAPAVPSLGRDNQLVRDASDRLRDGDAAGALALTDAHAREFPESGLADARAALRIEALCTQGKTAQARGEARMFARDHASSPVLARVERSCAGASVESADVGQATDR
jgi:RNA polymerase sigma-70 factor, ECF subfamily